VAQPSSQLRTLRDYIRFAVSRFIEAKLFFGHGTDNAWDEARHLVLGALHLPFETADKYLDCRLEEGERKHLQSLLQKRIQKRIPTAYLLGEALFCGLPFKVDSRVLIPRSPIGELIGQEFAPWLAAEPDKILDLCCGSGCIGIACAYAFEQAEVCLADISAEALQVAGQNIALHELQERVHCAQSDGFNGLTGQRFDLIVCNPPYVDAEDLASMPPEYQHEPRLALAAGKDGLDLVRRILAEAADYLTERGTLIVEVGNSQRHVEQFYPDIDFTWLEFSEGGHGVFLLAAKQCRDYQELLREHLSRWMSLYSPLL